MSKTFPTVFLVFLLAFAGFVHAADFDSGSANIDNIYMRAGIGDRHVLTGYGSLSGAYYYVDIVGTDTVDGVACVRVNVADTHNAWFSALWFAQDTTGSVYILKYYETDQPVPVTLGAADAFLWMPANPVVGQKFRDNGSQYQTVVELGVTLGQMPTGLGPYTGCLKTVDENGNFHYHAPGIGRVKEELADGTSGYDMKEILHATQSAAATKVVVIPLSD